VCLESLYHLIDKKH